MSSKVKQANFRLPLEYMVLIDEISKREEMTKASVITRALDCLKASYDSGNGGKPVTGGASSGASDAEVNDLKERLAKAEARAESATRELEALQSRLSSAEQARSAAESRANDALAARDAAESRARASAGDAAASSAAAASAAEGELRQLRDLVSKQSKMLEDKSSAKDLEIAEKNAAIAARDAKISSLTEQLGAANAKAELAMKNINVEAVTIDDPAALGGDEPTRALAMLNMIGGVMNAFQQQVDDARAVGEQEGRLAVRKELSEMVDKARNDGYRDAMGYLDDRVTTARETGAREERARIANMSFFERRRYLRMHIA